MAGEKSHLVEEQADNHSATQRGDDPRVLTAYRNDRLLVPTAALAATPGLIDGLNDQLAAAGKGRLVGGPTPDFAAGTAPALTRVRIEGGNAIEAWQAMRQQGGAPAGIMLERLIGTDTLVAFGEKQGHGDAGRMPVALTQPAPPWRTMPDGVRRAVVAVLDTGVAPHPWWSDTPAHDPFMIDAEKAHDWKSGLAAEAEGDRYTGHGTFIAGLIRQQAPDARVLSIRVMSADGVVHSSTFVDALDWLVRKIDATAPEKFVDVVCLAFGYKPKSPEDDQHTAELRTLIGKLDARNVRVVASAGNLGENVKTFPAGFAPDFAGVSSVGAKNPNGDKAHYSNHGDDWVEEWEVGTGLISAMPAANGPSEPAADAKANYPDTAGVAVDPDDFHSGDGVSGGFARWSGTSFAAAVHAGKCAHAIMGGPPVSPS